MLSGGIVGLIFSLIAQVLSKVGIHILTTPANETKVKHNEAKIDIEPDRRAAIDRFRKLQ